MRQRIVVRPITQLDIEDAAAGYESQRKGLGVLFLNDVGELLTRIAANPEQLHAMDGGTRRALLRRFPYAAYFAINGQQIAVIAVLRQSRHASSWNSAVNFLADSAGDPWPGAQETGQRCESEASAGRDAAKRPDLQPR